MKIRKFLTQSQRGSSFVETMVSVSLLSILGGGIFTIMMDSQGMFQTSLRSTRARQRTVDVFDLLNAELSQANLDTVQVDPDSSPFGDALQYQVPVAIDSGEITWGARVQDTTGSEVVWTEYTDHFVQILVVPQNNDTTFRLVRRIVDTDGIPVAPDELLAAEVDAPSSEGKGFTLERTGNLITATLRLRLTNTAAGVEANNRGEDVVRTHRTVIRVRGNS